MKLLNFYTSTLFFLSLPLHAGIKTHIVDLDFPSHKNDAIEVMATHEGRVFELDATQKDLIESLEFARDHQVQVEIEIQENAHQDRAEKILAVKFLENQSTLPEDLTSMDPMANFVPTIVESREQALEMFNSLNPRRKMFSQCFNRAHIWAKQLYDRYQVDSMKILIYYTRKFRKEVGGKWWFHIAPMVNVAGQYLVLDREFTHAPVTDVDWERIFTKKMGPTSYRCKKIINISEYYDQDNMNNEFCNIQHTSMYYWEPNDMRRLEKEGTAKTKWVNWELRAAAKEAFKGWRDVFEAVKVQ